MVTGGGSGTGVEVGRGTRVALGVGTGVGVFVGVDVGVLKLRLIQACEAAQPRDDVGDAVCSLRDGRPARLGDLASRIDELMTLRDDMSKYRDHVDARIGSLGRGSRSGEGPR